MEVPGDKELSLHLALNCILAFLQPGQTSEPPSPFPSLLVHLIHSFQFLHPEDWKNVHELCNIICEPRSNLAIISTREAR